MTVLKTIAFDADDTLWHTEQMFQDIQTRLAEILENYAPVKQVQDRLHATEMSNIKLFGYGAKGFTLSMIETAIDISRGKVTAQDIHEIIMLGKGLLEAPMNLIDGCAEVLEQLKDDYRLFLITKGDVLDQRNKIEKSGLESMFERTLVVQEKDAKTYSALFLEYDIDPNTLAMVGNSMRSDILPILELGGMGIYIPYEVTASFEIVDEDVTHHLLHRLDRISHLPEFLKRK